MENTTQQNYNIKFENLGTINKNKVTIGTLTLYFSYKTIVAFKLNGVLKVCSNVWSNTTAKLINSLEKDKTKHISYMVFTKELEQLLKDHNLFYKSYSE